MRIDRTVIAGVLFFALLAVYVYDGRRLARLEQERMTSARLLPFPKEQADAISIVRLGRRLELRRADDGWRIAAPVEARADRQTVDDLLYFLDKETLAAPRKAAQEELSAYGLAQPPVEVEVRGAGDEKLALGLGEPAPVPGEVYARRVGRNEYFTVDASISKQLRRPLYDYRDKRLLTLDAGAATTLSLTVEGRTATVEKQNEEEWRLVQPLREKADAARVKTILDELQSTQALDFIDTDTLELTRFGLTAPQMAATVEVQKGDERQSASLLIGHRRLGEKPAYYAMEMGRDVVFTVPQRLIDAMRVAPNDLRAKEIFTLPPDDVARFTLDFAGRRIELERDSAGAWRFADDDAEVDQYFVNNAIRRLLGLKIERFLDAQPPPAQSGLDEPTLVLTVGDASGDRRQWIETGLPAAKGDFVYARSWRGPEVFGIDVKEPGHFFLTREDFLDKTLFAFDPKLVEAVEIHSGGKSVSIRREELYWLAALEGGEQQFQVQPQKVQAFLLNFLKLRWRHRLDRDKPGDLTRIKTKGLENDDGLLILRDASGQALARLKIGGEDDQYFYIRRGENDFFAVERENFRSFAAALQSLLMS